MCVYGNMYTQFLSQTFQELVNLVSCSSTVLHSGTVHNMKLCYASFGSMSADLFCKLDGTASCILPTAVSGEMFFLD